MAQHKGAIPVNKTNWTPEKEAWLKENFDKFTNPELANQLGFTLTVVRNKTSELGLKHIELEYWTEEQIEYLKANYKTTGDVELAQIFEIRWPKNKRWIKQHICKKRAYLKLKRTPAQIKAIVSKHVAVGGRSHTIAKNSSSKNMHDSWIANQIAWRNKKLAATIKTQYPELIDLKRKQLQLNQQTKKI